MSYLSDLVRTFTGGQGIGETAGRGIGYVVSGGSQAGAEVGAKIGRTTTKVIDERFGDVDVSTAPASAGIDSAATISGVSQTGQSNTTGISWTSRNRVGSWFNKWSRS